MSTRHSGTSSTQAAVSPGGGCPSRYLLPPLAVLGVGTVLMLFSLSMTFPPNLPVSQPLQTGEFQKGGSIPILSPIFTPEVQHCADKIQGWSASAGIDPNLVATVMQIESCGDPQALSRSGAMGLFQVMPYHFI